MIRALEIESLWWLPEKPNERFPGILCFSLNEGFSLEIQGLFTDELSKPDIILGFSHEGKKITLYKCFETSRVMRFPGTPKSTFVANFGFIGSHFENPSEIKFERTSVKYNHLDEWLNISGFKEIHSDPEKGAVEIKYESPKPMEINLKNGFKILMEFYVDLPKVNISTAQKEACIKQEAFFTLEYPHEQTFEEIIEYVYIFQNLLSILTSETIYPIGILGYTKNSRESVEIIYQPSYQIRSGKTADILYTYSAIADKIETIFNNWLESYELLSPIYELYFGTIYGDTYLETQFLNLTMVLEVYHRRLIGNEEIPREEHEKRVSRILDSVPNEYQDWLREKLKYSNEPSLRRKLKEIYERLKSIKYVAELISNKKFFVDRVVSTRNYLVHYDRFLKSKALEGAELFWYVQKLKALVEICLLKVLGFTDEEIDKAFQQNKKYKSLIEELEACQK